MKRLVDRFEWGLFLLIAGVLVYQVILPPIVGLADNGDFNRIIEPLGLEHTSEEWGDRYFLHVNRNYTIVPRIKPFLLSSELLLGELAVAANRVISRGRSFDLLAMGIVHLLVYLIGVHLILRAGRTFSRPARIVIGLALLLAGTDVAYVSVFNSFYTECASLVFLTILIGVALLGLRAASPGRWFVPTFFLVAALFISAKPQNYLLALPLACVPALLLARPRRGSRHHRRRGTRIAEVASVAGGLLILAGVLYLRVPPSFRSPILWDTIFYSILKESPSPERDLEQLGLDPGLARYAGVPAWAGDVETPHPEAGERTGFGAIGLFYLRHPGRFLGISERCARQTFAWRDPQLGNFTKDAGHPPGARSREFAGWSDLEGMALPKSLGFLVPFFGLFLAGCAWQVRKHGLRGPAGATAAFCAVIAVTAILEFMICVFAEGTKDIIKHLHLFQVLFDACLVAGLAWGADRIGKALPWGWWRSAAVPEHPDAPTRS